MLIAILLGFGLESLKQTIRRCQIWPSKGLLVYLHWSAFCNACPQTAVICRSSCQSFLTQRLKPNLALPSKPWARTDFDQLPMFIADRSALQPWITKAGKKTLHLLHCSKIFRLKKWDRDTCHMRTCMAISFQRLSPGWLGKRQTSVRAWNTMATFRGQRKCQCPSRLLKGCTEKSRPPSPLFPVVEYPEGTSAFPSRNTIGSWPT